MPPHPLLQDVGDTLEEIFWGSNQPEAKFIIGLIFSLLIISTVVTTRHVIRYWREGRGVKRVEKNLKNWIEQQKRAKEKPKTTHQFDVSASPAGPVETAEAEADEEAAEADEEAAEANGKTAEADAPPDTQQTSPPPDEPNRAPEGTMYQPTAIIKDLKKDVGKKLIIWQRLDTLDKLKKHRIKIDVNVLQKLSIAAEARRWTVRIPDLVKGMAMLLGLLGTFYGLTIMVQEIGQQLDTVQNVNLETMDESMQRIRHALVGVSTAFHTTLAGLICTIIVSLFTFFLEKMQSSYFEQLESFTANQLLPATVPVLEGESLLEQISYRLRDSFGALNETLEENRLALSELGAIYKTFEFIVKEMRRITQREASHPLEKVIRELHTVNGTLKDMINKYENKNILKKIQDLAEVNKKQIKDYNSMLTDAVTLPGWLKHTRLILIVIVILLGIISIPRLIEIVTPLVAALVQAIGG